MKQLFIYPLFLFPGKIFCLSKTGHHKKGQKSKKHKNILRLKRGWFKNSIFNLKPCFLLTCPNLGIVFSKTNKMVQPINNWILFQNFCCLSQIWSKLTFSLELACCNYLLGQFGHCLFWRKTRWSSYQIVTEY